MQVIPPPTCDIKLPSVYLLGVLHLGETKTHPSLDIMWNCTKYQDRTSLSASVVIGELNSLQDKVQMVVNGKKTELYCG